MDSETPQRRRDVLRAAGGALGVSALSGVAGAESADLRGESAEVAQQGAQGERIGMVTADSTQVFTSPLVWIPSGTTVTWHNQSGAHSSTAYAPANDKPNRIPEDAEGWNSETLTEQGATFERTFDTAGVYDYYCIPHEALGMVGRVVVGTPNLENAPALAPPQDSIPSGASEALTALNSLTRALFSQSQS